MPISPIWMSPFSSSPDSMLCLESSRVKSSLWDENNKRFREAAARGGKESPDCLFKTASGVENHVVGNHGDPPQISRAQGSPVKVAAALRPGANISPLFPPFRRRLFHLVIVPVYAAPVVGLA
jgi:hypothetical protein